MLSLIVAIANNNKIGMKGQLLCKLPEDLKYVKQVTLNQTLIMGRKTYESLPRILPNRKHIIITRNENYHVENEMVRVVHSLDEAILEFKKASTTGDEAFIFGGGDIYKDALALCERLYITEIYGDFEADTFFPEFDRSKYTTVSKSEILTDDVNGIQFRWVVLEKQLS